MEFQINLKAGQWSRQQTAGRLFFLIDTGAAASVELRLEVPGDDEEFSQAKRGLKARLQGGMFQAVQLRSTVDCVARFVISQNDIDFSDADGATVKVQNTGTPIQVSNDRGTPGNLLYVSGVSLADAPATALTNGGPVACTPAGVVVAAANANRRALRFLNLGPDAVALGGAGLTWAKRAIVLEVGDLWIEDRAANVAWTAITDAAKSASVNVQEVVA